MQQYHLGANIIEKHFTLNRKDGGVDATFSLEPNEFKQLVSETYKAWLSLGKINYGVTEEETNSLKFRRSIYFVKDIKQGEKITEDNVRVIRPGLGLKPKYFNIILNRTVIKNIDKGTPVDWNLIK